MSDQTNTPAAGISQEAHTAAVNAARAEGEKAATTRIGAILRSEAAKGKQKLAMTLAFDTALSVAEAEKALAAAAPEDAPKAETPDPAKQLEQRSQGLGEFGATGPAPSQAETSRSGWQSAVRNANQAIGVRS